MKARHITSLISGSLILGTLAGCGFDREPPDYPRPIETPKEFFDLGQWRQQPATPVNYVETVDLTHRVGFATKQSKLSVGEVRGIHAFLREGEVAGRERVLIDGPRNDAGYHDPLTAARLATVKAEVERSGLTAQIADEPIDDNIGRLGEITLIVSRVVVLPPDCSVPQPLAGDRPKYHFGCANVANLGEMAADPLDLERGRPLGPADAEGSGLAIQRYRTDNVRPIDRADVVTEGGS